MSTETNSRAFAAPPFRPNRHIDGCSAVLLPFRGDGSVDWRGFEAHLARTIAAGITPAVNMDTGWVHVLDAGDKARVLEIAAAAGAPFLAGAYVADTASAAYDEARHLMACETIRHRGGTPVIFPSHGLASLSETEWIAAHETFGSATGGFVAFELGSMFHPAGRIVSIEAYEALLGIPACMGAKHSSLRRDMEWQRLELRDRVRADFRVYTGNDLAIDMVMWGSDYLLGLSTFAPDAFARRDAYWEAGDARFFELNDLLQYLGQVAFRPPVPAYRHSAAQFLTILGHLAEAAVPAGQPSRTDSDIPILEDIARRLEALLA